MANLPTSDSVCDGTPDHCDKASTANEMSGSENNLSLPSLPSVVSSSSQQGSTSVVSLPTPLAPVNNLRRHTTDNCNSSSLLPVTPSTGSSMPSPHSVRMKPEGVTFCMPVSDEGAASPNKVTNPAPSSPNTCNRSALRHSYHSSHNSGAVDATTSSSAQLSPTTHHPSNVNSRPDATHEKKNSTGTVSNNSSALRAPVTPDPRIVPNLYIRTKLEALIERMQSPGTAIEVKNRKNFLKTIPSVFTSHDLMLWLERHLHIMDHAEAQHVASMLSAMGYLFCIDDNVLAVRGENQLMRFQTPWLYPGMGSLEAEEVDYAVYLCKRTMRNKTRMELTDFEAERLARLQSFFYHKWEFVYMKAEAEMKVDKKRRDKNESYVLESQERAFWNFHRPGPGTVNMTDVDMRKLCCAKRPKKDPVRHSHFPLSSNVVVSSLVNTLDTFPLADRVLKLRNAIDRPRVKMSRAIDNLLNFYEQYCEFDLLLNASTMQGVSSLPLLNSSSSPMPGGGSAAPLLGNVAGGVDLTLMGNSPAHATGSSSHFLLHNMPSVIGAASPSPQTLPSSGSISNGDTGIASSNTSTNPWICDNQAYWEGEKRLRDLPVRRVKRWGFRIHELLRDPVGREEFLKWLEKEFSVENLHFYEACQELKGAPLREVSDRINKIYNNFLAPNATESLNVDSRVAESVRNRVARITAGLASHADRYCFEEAEEHIFRLMKNDSYSRYLRSDMYKDLVSGQKKKSKKRFVTPDVRQKPNLMAISGDLGSVE